MQFHHPMAVSSGRTSYDGHLQYDITVRQQPMHARISTMKPSDRRPVDPPIVVQLSVRDRRYHDSEPSPVDSPSTASSNQNLFGSSHLTNPYYFMYANLVEPHNDVEVNFASDGSRSSTSGALVSSVRVLKDYPNSDAHAAFFIFPDICVRLEGSWRFKLSLFVIDGDDVKACKTIFSNPFFVYPGKHYPGVEVSTPLTRALAAQGVKLRIRKELREKTRVKDEPAPPEALVEDPAERGKTARKRRRTRTGSAEPTPSSEPSVWIPLRDSDTPPPKAYAADTQMLAGSPQYEARFVHRPSFDTPPLPQRNAPSPTREWYASPFTGSHHLAQSPSPSVPAPRRPDHEFSQPWAFNARPTHPPPALDHPYAVLLQRRLPTPSSTASDDYRSADTCPVYSWSPLPTASREVQSPVQAPPTPHEFWHGPVPGSFVSEGTTYYQSGRYRELVP
ncbi:velvet factor-domain-containing protein [Mycena sp. CBHHK59/15]|nr:velvet factor-domain-containing protein [Mycena sp. CBHHK59/15]